MNLKSLIQRELTEGTAEKELASTIGVPTRTIDNILADTFPEDPAEWGKFSKYFRMDVEFLRTGESTHSITIHNLAARTRQSPAGLIRRVPLLNWQQMDQLVRSKLPPGVIHADMTVETTDVSGKRTLAVKVRDDSMEPLFSEGEIFFVNPDRKWKPGDYVIINRSGGHPEAILLRQVNAVGSRYMLHPLNRKYEDLPLTKQDKVWGKVIRLRKNL